MIDSTVLAGHSLQRKIILGTAGKRYVGWPGVKKVKTQPANLLVYSGVFFFASGGVQEYILILPVPERKD